jgi:hypothetical protein
VCTTFRTVLNSLISETAEICVEIIQSDLFGGGDEGELLTARHHVDVTYFSPRSPFISIFITKIVHLAQTCSPNDGSDVEWIDMGLLRDASKSGIDQTTAAEVPTRGVSRRSASSEN